MLDVALDLFQESEIKEKYIIQFWRNKNSVNTKLWKLLDATRSHNAIAHDSFDIYLNDA